MCYLIMAHFGICNGKWWERNNHRKLIMDVKNKIIEEIRKILNEAIDAVDNGYKEITLLGQNVNSYKFENIGFHDLLESIAQIKDLKRIRYCKNGKYK